MAFAFTAMPMIAEKSNGPNTKPRLRFFLCLFVCWFFVSQYHFCFSCAIAVAAVAGEEGTALALGKWNRNFSPFNVCGYYVNINAILYILPGCVYFLNDRLRDVRHLVARQVAREHSVTRAWAIS